MISPCSYSLKLGATSILGRLEQRIRNTVSIAFGFISELSNMALNFIPRFSHKLMPLKNIADLEDELDNGTQPKFEIDTCSWNDFRSSEIDKCVEILAGNNI